MSEVHKNKECWGEMADEIDPSQFLHAECEECTDRHTNIYMRGCPFRRARMPALPRNAIFVDRGGAGNTNENDAASMQRFTFRLHNSGHIMKLSNVWVTDRA